MDNTSSESNTTNLNDLGINLENPLPEWTYTFQIVFIVIIATVGIPGNSLVVFVQCKNHDKSSTDYLVLTMALFELICSSVNSALYIIRNLKFVWKRIASESICRTHYFAVTVISISCTLLLTAIALDRYFKTCRPFNMLFSKANTKRLCILIASASLIFASPILGTSAYNVKTLTCSIDTKSISLGQIQQVLLAISFFTMFIVVAVSYTRITIALRKRYQQKVIAKSFRTNGNTSRTDELVLYTHTGRSSGTHKSNKVVPQTETVTKGSDIPTQVNTTKNSINNAVNLPVNGVITSSPVASFHMSQESEINDDECNPENSFVPELKEIQSKILSDCAASGINQNAQTHRTTRKVRQAETIYDIDMSNSIEQIGSSTTVKLERPKFVTYEEVDAVEKISHRRLFKEEQKLNRTTLIMFLVTVVYILSWLTHWIVYGLSTSDTVSGRMAIQLTKTSFMINCMTNPVFYICMSSLFRKNAKQLLCSRRL